MTRAQDLIAVDVDRTLFTSEGVVSPRTRDALRAVRDDGALVMIASGRPEHGLRLMAEREGLGLDNLVLSSCNGAAVVDAATEEIICHRVVERELVDEVLALVAHYGLGAMSPVGDHLYATGPDVYWLDHESEGNGLRPILAPTLGDEPLHKVLISADPAVMATHAPLLREALAGRAEVALSTACYFEVTAPGVDKGSGLLDFCAARGIDPARTIAFGDSENDLPMLRAAGIGVAMGNAQPDVLAVADRVTASNDEDGIAVALGH